MQMKARQIKMTKEYVKTGNPQGILKWMDWSAGRRLKLGILNKNSVV